MPSWTVDRALGGHAVGDEHLADGLRRRDEAVHLPLFPSRERVAAQVKIDAARRDERRRAATRALGGRRPHRQRQRGHRDAVRVVRVDDVGGEPPDDSREPPGRGQIHLGARRDRNQIQAFGRAAAELAVRVRDQRGAMPDRSQTVHGQQHLVLAAAPRSRRVDVKGEHLRPAANHEDTKVTKIHKVASCSS